MDSDPGEGDIHLERRSMNPSPFQSYLNLDRSIWTLAQTSTESRHPRYRKSVIRDYLLRQRRQYTVPGQIILERGIHDVAHRPSMSLGEVIGRFDQISWEMYIQASAAHGS